MQIFFFCFNFLKHIVSENFSVIRKPRWVFNPSLILVSFYCNVIVFNVLLIYLVLCFSIQEVITCCLIYGKITRLGKYINVLYIAELIMALVHKSCMCSNLIRKRTCIPSLASLLFFSYICTIKLKSSWSMYKLVYLFFVYGNLAYLYV